MAPHGDYGLGMALKVLPPDTPAQAEARSFLVDELRPVADRIAAHDLSLISIGSRCTTCGALDAVGLRDKAYPFDWLYSSLPMVEHCLRDDFTEFLNPDQYEPVPVEARAKPSIHCTQHRLYRDSFGVEHVFNHHEMPEALEHFERAVTRFRQAPNPHLIHISRHSGPQIIAQVEAVARLTDAQVLAICIAPAEPGISPGLIEAASGDGYMVYEMTTEAPLAALGFATAEDELAFGQILIDHFA